MRIQGENMHWEYTLDAYPIGGPLSTGLFDQTVASEKLNDFGAKGWELVSSYPTAQANGGTRMLVFVYRRPKESTHPVATVAADPVVFRRDPIHR
jgi:hypothetical protein